VPRGVYVVRHNGSSRNSHMPGINPNAAQNPSVEEYVRNFVTYWRLTDDIKLGGVSNRRDARARAIPLPAAVKLCSIIITRFDAAVFRCRAVAHHNSRAVCMK
jgi:hypothetical protein